MVRSHKSPARKSCPSVRRQSDSDLMDMETDVTEPPHTASQPRENTRALDQKQPLPPHAETGSEAYEPLDGPDDGSSLSNAKWRPIPPLLPEHHSQIEQDSATKEQCCQTDEQLHYAGHCVEPGDPPLLQQPLHTSKSGIQQIIECFRTGTSQLKNMLLKEVDTIFECKLCRSLFRGLPNLITHKEYYCLSRLPDADGGDGDKQALAMKDLVEAIYPRAERPDFVVRLEPIQTSSKAVFQYLTTEEEMTRYPSRTPSARESPVAWEGQSMESVDTNQPSQLVETESRRSPSPPPVEKVEPSEEIPAPPPAEEEESNSGVEDVTISCCLCGQDFNSRRSIRRHCRKMHQTKLEELRKYTETRTVPTSLLSMVKGRQRTVSTPTGKSCPVCLKTFATKANVRRHFDEVHRGLRRDNMALGIPTKPDQPFILDESATNRSNTSSPAKAVSSKPSSPSQAKPQSTPNTQSSQSSSMSCRCSLCKRTYSSQLMLKRHMRIVHKIYSSKNRNSGSTTANADTSPPPVTSPSLETSTGTNNVKVKQETIEPSDEEGQDEHEEAEEEEEEEEGVDVDSSPPPSPSDSTGTAKSAHTKAVKVKEEETSPSQKSGVSIPPIVKHNALSVGFDFKQLFCKLCKRQFSSRQNLSKHIELHTDGTDIFIKFYRCPLCSYESRRKRDVLRHVTVVHKKSSSYLAKIMPKLESRAVKKQAEDVLSSNSTPNKRTEIKEEVNGRHYRSPSPLSRRQEGSLSASSSSAHHSTPRKQQEHSSGSSSAPATRKCQPRPVSPPMTRHSHQRASSISPHIRRQDTQDESGTAGSTEVRVTKNFSLHACDQCGRAFAKKVFLESHKLSHRNAPAAEATRKKGVNTRSRSLIW
ncbi:unnamed protein product [Knipowitschia caucasica]